MNRLAVRWKKFSVKRKLYLVVGTMAVLVAFELFVLKNAMELVSSVRAFVEGEALWSKAQKNSLLELDRFVRTHDEKSYQAFLDHLQVPGGDHLARLELLKPHPDMAVVREGFLQGRIHPDDIHKMIWLLQRFHWISYVSEATLEWAHGDENLQKIKETASRLHAAVLAGDTVTADLLLNEINDLNSQLTPIEDRFSSILSDGSRWLESKALTIFILMVALVESTGLTLTIVTGREIGSIADENARLLKEATQSVQTRDEFLSVASHELKTPLTSLGLQLQLIRRAATKMEDSEQSEKLLTLADQSISSSRRLADLLEELLDLTRIRFGRLEIHKEKCNFTSIVQDAVMLLGAEAAKHGSAISMRSSGVIMGMFDRNRILQVATNLISNAIKYGEGRPIAVLVERQSQKVKLIVQDRGKGISEEKLPQLFRRFERFEHDPSIPGLGLGLYISQQIVITHGGSITAASVLGEGSVFTVEIPLDVAIADIEGPRPS